MSKYSTHRYCGSCYGWHRIDGRPCEACWGDVVCARCGTHGPVPDGKNIVCQKCGQTDTLPWRLYRRFIHPRDLKKCPRCGRLLRMSQRDDRRANGLKRAAPKLVIQSS